MSTPVVVSFYTPDYAEHAERFIADLVSWDLWHVVKPLADLGSWQLNTHHKPAFLLEAMREFATPVVWIDVDARIEQYPELLYQTEADVAYHVFRLSGGREEALSGTVYVENERFLRDWIRECERTPDVWDQVAMERAAKAYDVKELPAEYCWIEGIFDKPFYKNNHPNVGEPVIRHLQASRALRNVRP